MTTVETGSRATLGFVQSIQRGAHMPESGLPIRVYKEHGMWHVDYGEGEIEDYHSREEAESAADALAQAEERSVVVEEQGPTPFSESD
jgi:hypothetical protein